MRRILLTCALLAALVAPASAAVDTSKLQLPGDLTLEQAQKVVDGALAFAKKQGVPMNITVIDAGGNLKAFCRMDGAFFGGGELLKDKNGVIVGAIGVSGGTVQEDTNVAKAGVASLNK